MSGKNKEVRISNPVFADTKAFRKRLESQFEVYGKELVSQIVALGCDETGMVQLCRIKGADAPEHAGLTPTPAFIPHWNYIGYIGRSGGTTFVDSAMNLGTGVVASTMVELVNILIQVFCGSWTDIFLATPRAWVGSSYTLPQDGAPASITYTGKVCNVRVIPSVDGAGIAMTVDGKKLVSLKKGGNALNASAWDQLFLTGNTRGLVLDPRAFLGRVEEHDGKIRFAVTSDGKSFVLERSGKQLTVVQVINVGDGRLVGFTDNPPGSMIVIQSDGTTIIRPVADSVAQSVADAP